MMFKPAELDTTAKVVTIIVCAFLVGLSVFFIIKVPYGWFFAIGMMLIPVFSYALSPRQYRLDGSGIIIRKVVGKTITIPAHEIQGYTVVTDLARIKMIRVFGNGGLFGYYGMFSVMGYGPLNCQLTRWKQVVIVKTPRMLYALSPDDLDGFVTMLRSTTSCRALSFDFSGSDKAARVRLAILIIPAAVYVATIIVLLFAYRSLPERIAVHFDAFGTPDRWGPRISYLVSGIIPATILFALNCGIFLAMRRTAHRKNLPVFLVIIIAWLQVFVLFIEMDVYWLNSHGHHIMPFLHSLGIFAGLTAVLLFFYYRIATAVKT